MKTIFTILLVLFTIIFIWDRLTRKYCTWEQFNYFIGKPNVGKTTWLTMIAYKGIKKGYHVYCSEKITVKIKDKKRKTVTNVEVPQIDPRQLYRYKFPAYSWVLIDEIGICFNNRKFKTFDDRLLETFKKYRHRHLRYYVCSQSTDCDATIRRIVTQYYLLSKWARCLVVARRLIATPIVVKPTAESPASIQDDFKEDPKLLKPVLGGIQFCWIPKYAHMFDSFEINEQERSVMDIDYSQDPLPYEPPVIYSRRKEWLMVKKAQISIAWTSFLLSAKKRLRMEQARLAKLRNRSDRGVS